MRLVSYESTDGPAWGVVRDGHVVQGRDLLQGRYPDVRSVLADQALDAVADAARSGTPGPALADVRLLPPVPNPDKILCVGLNYRAHAAEAGREVPAQPSIFVRLANTLVGHQGAIVRPRVSAALDFEGELALVIGRAGRHIPAARAWEHIAGYACFNDASVRDYQKHSITAGKNFPATAAFGPWLVSADEVGEPAALELSTQLNGERVQHAGVSAMLYPIPELIAYLSTITRLEPGDVIATGTPAGVGLGRTPPLWMRPGDTVEVEVSGLGVLSNRIVDEPQG